MAGIFYTQSISAYLPFGAAYSSTAMSAYTIDTEITFWTCNPCTGIDDTVSAYTHLPFSAAHCVTDLFYT
jgi:hypothetical protein